MVVGSLYLFALGVLVVLVIFGIVSVDPCAPNRCGVARRSVCGRVQYSTDMQVIAHLSGLGEGLCIDAGLLVDLDLVLLYSRHVTVPYVVHHFIQHHNSPHYTHPNPSLHMETRSLA